jgi:Dr1-associated corepressor
MQADEDVGKVAQVTPVAICVSLMFELMVAKALELFMERIVKAVAEETTSRGARRVTPSHFKQIISTQKEYDFLESLTAEIPLPPSRPSTPPPTIRRRRKQSPTPSGVADGPPKRKRRSPDKGKGRSPAASPDVKSSEMEDVKIELDVKMEQAELTERADHPERAGHAEHSEEKRRGWFDIVMGSSNEHDLSED